MILDALGLYFLVGLLISPTLMVWRMGLPDEPPMWEVLLAGVLFIPVWPVVTVIAIVMLVHHIWWDLKDRFGG